MIFEGMSIQGTNMYAILPIDWRDASGFLLGRSELM